MVILFIIYPHPSVALLPRDSSFRELNIILKKIIKAIIKRTLKYQKFMNLITSLKYTCKFNIIIGILYKN